MILNIFKFIVLSMSFAQLYYTIVLFSEIEISKLTGIFGSVLKPHLLFFHLGVPIKIINSFLLRRNKHLKSTINISRIFNYIVHLFFVVIYLIIILSNVYKEIRDNFVIDTISNILGSVFYSIIVIALAGLGVFLFGGILIALFGDVVSGIDEIDNPESVLDKDEDNKFEKLF
jgi:hypothetical protein